MTEPYLNPDQINKSALHKRSTFELALLASHYPEVSTKGRLIRETLASRRAIAAQFKRCLHRIRQGRP